MRTRAVWSVVVVMLLAVMAVAQGQEQYLDIFIAQVKPEKRADFDAISKKIAVINRQNGGDQWLAMETDYGPMNRVTMISTRNGYAEVQKGNDAFIAALQKSLGKDGADKLFADFAKCLENGRTELRRRRWDLSSNAPSDAAALAKMIGEARYLRTTTIRIKPGQGPVIETLLKDVKAAREKSSPDVTTLVSQGEAGQEGTMFYVTTLEKSMGGFDAVPPLRKAMGDEAYERYLKTASEVVVNTETVISHFLPEISNPAPDVIAAAPDYWTPKEVVAKGSSQKKPVVNASQTNKMDANK
jgi:hypothetical protein